MEQQEILVDLVVEEVDMVVTIAILIQLLLNQLKIHHLFHKQDSINMATQVDLLLITIQVMLVEEVVQVV